MQGKQNKGKNIRPGGKREENDSNRRDRVSEKACTKKAWREDVRKRRSANSLARLQLCQYSWQNKEPRRRANAMLKRFSISLEEKLLDIFDQHIKAQKYNNRSEAIRDLIRKAFVQEEWAQDKQVMGVISLVYDHHQPKLQEKITVVQHAYHQQIVSTTHVHMDHNTCLEVIVVRGKGTKIKELASELSALKGVGDANLAMSSTGKFLH